MVVLWFFGSASPVYADEGYVNDFLPLAAISLDSETRQYSQIDESFIIATSAPYQPALVVATIAKAARKVSKTVYTSCVLFYRAVTGDSTVKGNAYSVKPLDDEPHIGGAVLFHYGKTGHVAVITSIASESFNIVEANFSAGAKTSRTISFDDPHIVGFR